MEVPMSGYTKDHAKKGLDAKLPSIETWPNQFPSYEITIEAPEFTSVCPKTGLPDFGLLVLRYTPSKACLELKSYKEYLMAYRNLGVFYENAVNRVLRDVVNACKPEQASLTGVFNSRGGLGASVVATYTRKGGFGS
jgi:7-cyano-7-deazaguanine reductase